jgi:nitrate/nitrite transporter NarK
MWPVTLTYFCYGWCLWLYLSYLPMFFKDTFSLSNSDAALFSTIVYFIGAIGNTRAAWSRTGFCTRPAMSLLRAFASP